MDELIEGYRRFRATVWREHRELFSNLVKEGQSPSTMIITCSDSRVDPQLIFGAKPGDLFVVRNVASLVPPYAPDSEYHGTSAALEFAVRVLQVREIVVMGHAHCGGVRALLEGAPETVQDFVAPWMSIANAARDHALSCSHDKKDQQRICEHETVRVSLTNLMSFPWIRERVESGLLSLHGCYFDMASGELEQIHTMSFKRAA